ncbi:diphthine synthase isoform b [Chiua virens]|nr:diphthine synthase isoform b [Chiua virens]
MAQNPLLPVVEYVASRIIDTATLQLPRYCSLQRKGRGLEAVQSSTRVYLEAYTSILMVPKERLASRSTHVSSTSPDRHPTPKKRSMQDVSFLVVGDPFGATTHIDIVLRARAKHIPSVSLVFFTDTWKPDSFYDRIKENSDLGLHTLILLDIKVKEQSEENMARGRKIYEPPRYMSIPQAISQLLEIESHRDQKVLSPETTLAIALSRVGGDPDDQRIVSGTLEELLQQPLEVFEEPLHSLVIGLYHLEDKYAQQYAINRETWRRVASQDYCCALE